jgi:hypothetical protein
MGDNNLDVVTLRYLLKSLQLSIATLATAIEQDNVYTWDRFGRFVVADADEKKRALDLLAEQHEWNEESEYEKVNRQSPLDECDGPSDPFSSFGWLPASIPNFDAIGAAADTPKPLGRGMSRRYAEKTDLKIIGALLTLLLEMNAGGTSRHSFKNQSAIVGAILEKFEGKHGFSQRTLEGRFAAANQALA